MFFFVCDFLKNGTNDFFITVKFRNLLQNLQYDASFLRYLMQVWYNNVIF